MKAITIHQPWATLIALGEKRFETRGWPTKHRGPIAIHAGKKIDELAFCDWPICETLRKHGIVHLADLPTGKIVATANMTECWRVIGIADVPVKETSVLSSGNRMFGITPATEEYQFGDFSEGRYAWELTDVQPLPVPLPAKGQQGFWNWTEER